MQPIYIKSVAVQFGEQKASFYDYDPMKNDSPPRRLEPGESANYSRVWGKNEFLNDMNKAKGQTTIEIDTTRNHFFEPAGFRVVATN